MKIIIFRIKILDHMSSAVYKYLRYLKSQILFDNSAEFLAIDLSFVYN